jgi:hypothetical protein
MVLLGFEAVVVPIFPLLSDVERNGKIGSISLQTIEHANDYFSHTELQTVMSSHIFSLCAHLICLIKFIYMLPFLLASAVVCVLIYFSTKKDLCGKL